MKELSEVKDSLDMEVKQNFIDPLQNLHDKDLREIQVLSSMWYLYSVHVYKICKCSKCVCCLIKSGLFVYRGSDLSFTFQFCLSHWWVRRGRCRWPLAKESWETPFILCLLFPFCSSASPKENGGSAPGFWLQEEKTGQAPWWRASPSTGEIWWIKRNCWVKHVQPSGDGCEISLIYALSWILTTKEKCVFSSEGNLKQSRTWKPL